jgi:hypothetical protein
MSPWSERFHGGVFFLRISNFDGLFALLPLLIHSKQKPRAGAPVTVGGKNL